MVTDVTTRPCWKRTKMSQWYYYFSRTQEENRETQIVQELIREYSQKWRCFGSLKPHSSRISFLSQEHLHVSFVMDISLYLLVTAQYYHILAWFSNWDLQDVNNLCCLANTPTNLSSYGNRSHSDFSLELFYEPHVKYIYVSHASRASVFFFQPSW